MKKLALLAILALLLAGMFILAGCKTQKTDEAVADTLAEAVAEPEALDYTNPEAVVLAYFDAWTQGDVEGVMATTVKGLEAKPETKEVLMKDYQAKMKAPVLSELKILSSKIEEDKAEFQLSVKADGQPGTFPAYVVKIMDKWYVDERKG